MSQVIDVERARRENARWLIILTLNVARPVGASETLVLTTLQGVHERVTQHELRKELEYLHARGLVELETGGPQWFAHLTREGVDVAEYTVDVEPGIARPPKYW